MRIIDLHQDILQHQDNQEIYQYKKQTSLDQIMQSDIKIVFGTGFVVGKDKTGEDDFFAPDCMRLIEKDMDAYIRYAKSNPDFVIIKNDSDFEEVVGLDRNSNKKGVIVHIEGLNTFEDTEECWSTLERFYEKGLRSIGITWTLENSLGGGNNADPECGLTPLGEKLIRWAYAKGVLIDFAHMNEKTFSDTTQILQQMPIFISHGNARALCSSNRNYSDEQLIKVQKSGGLIGIFFANNCLVSEGLATIDDVVRHISYIRDLIGVDYVSIGSDLGGLTLNIPEGLRDIHGFGNLKDALVKASFSMGDIEKIFFENASRFLKLSFSQKSSTIQ